MRNEISDKKKPRYRREFLEMQYVAFFSQTIHLHNPKPGNSHGLEDQVLGKMFVRHKFGAFAFLAAPTF